MYIFICSSVCMRSGIIKMLYYICTCFIIFTWQDMNQAANCQLVNIDLFISSQCSPATGQPCSWSRKHRQ